MTLRSEIRAALADSPKTAAQLVEDCDSASDAAAMANNLWALKKEGKVKIAGTVEGRNAYLIDEWPEKAPKTDRADSAPPPKAARRNKSAPRAPRSRPADALSRPPAANGCAQFAINESGRAGHRESRGADPARPRRIRAAAHLHRARRIDLQSHGMKP